MILLYSKDFNFFNVSKKFLTFHMFLFFVFKKLYNTMLQEPSSRDRHRTTKKSWIKLLSWTLIHCSLRLHMHKHMHVYVTLCDFYLKLHVFKQISIWIAKSAYFCMLSSIFMVLPSILLKKRQKIKILIYFKVFQNFPNSRPMARPAGARSMARPRPAFLARGNATWRPCPSLRRPRPGRRGRWSPFI